MKPAEAESKIGQLIGQYDPDTRKLIHAARTVMQSAFPGSAETADSAARLLAYSYGPGYKGTVATLILSKKAVKIGIPFGASLPDPGHLLAGAGKVHRHVPVREAADLKSAALKAVLRVALSAWRERAGRS